MTATGVNGAGPAGALGLASQPALDRILLPPKRGFAPSSRPPVRIFLGTEPSQYRAERVFVWSVAQTRDPSRAYEIYLMKGLAGFRKLFWTTSFTNYRFAVPELAGLAGRAIYNDVDQIYLSDPAELFDTDLEGNGFLAISETETSVMLIDCARMGGIWNLEAARRGRKKQLLRRALEKACYGPLAGDWNARDAREYVAGRTKLLHFTTLHTQPWRPFPERFLYQENPLGRLFFEREREADASGFRVFTRARPSRHFPAWAAEQATRHSAPAPPPAPSDLETTARMLVRRDGLRSVLELVPDGRAPEEGEPARFGGERVRREGLVHALRSPEPIPLSDAVICTAGLEGVPADDVPWVVDELFRRAGRLLFCAVRDVPRPPRRRIGLPPRGTAGTAIWWEHVFRSAAASRPEVHWELAVSPGPDFGGDLEYRQGGRFAGSEPPRVWLLGDHKPGHSTQALGLADELGWPCEQLVLSFGPLAELPSPLLGATLAGLRARDRRRLRPPWPDLVIAPGRRTAPVAQWIRRQSRGRTRTVHLGRMATTLADRFDLAVAPSYARLYPDPRRMQTLAPLTKVSETALTEAALQWRSLFEGALSPRIVLLVGGGSPDYELTPEVARRLGRDVCDMVEKVGGSVFVTTSRRTSPAAADALEDAMSGAARFHRWSAGSSPERNPYLGYLALADALVVTGESASMLAEACATGKPVYIYPLPRRSRGLRGLASAVLQRAGDAVVARAHARPQSWRGATRPQRGLELWCARLLANGIVWPSVRIEDLHRALIDRGVAHRFDGSFVGTVPEPFREVGRVAARVRSLLGLPAPDAKREGDLRERR